MASWPAFRIAYAAVIHTVVPMPMPRSCSLSDGESAACGVRMVASATVDPDCVNVVGPQAKQTREREKMQAHCEGDGRPGQVRTLEGAFENYGQPNQ